MTGAQHQQSISSTPKAIIDRATYLPMSYLLVTLKPTTYGLKSHSMILHSLDWNIAKVSFFIHCLKRQLIKLQKFHNKAWFSPFLWFFNLKCWFKGQKISRIHLSLPNAYKLCFDRNINGNRDDNFFEWDYWSLHWQKKLTLEIYFSLQWAHQEE